MLDHTFGLHASSVYRLNGGSDAILQFTEVADEFWVHTLTGASGTFSMQVDAQTAVTGSLAVSNAGASQAREIGYYNNGSANAHNVYKISTGSTASHTLKITPSATAGQNVFVSWVEARVNGSGRFRVSNVSISGKSLATAVTLASNYSDDNGLFGYPHIDSYKADLLVVCLGVNDWQGQYSLADSKTRLVNIIQRQRSSITTGGVVAPAGDVVLMWNPKPDVATLGGGTYLNPTWDAYRDLYYQVAEEQDVALIDLGGRWKDYTTANSFGLYADTIHPNDKGAGDVAGSVERALFTEA
jgi:lysophospholipase L1-like esterase